MTDQPVLQQASQLRTALDALAAALTAGDAMQVLACEPRLTAALADVRVPAGGMDAATRAALDGEVRQARRALERCRLTGLAAAALTAATLDALRGQTAYGRSGSAPEAPPIRGRGVEARG